ncbi:class I SAM-dependent methyltransferase [Amaricoccus solimangrovi]|uniref:Class I SAM-dependent methyltransferase n=1 Tax=Amaricoccus solimangrovi TaxID=2589815 RepID=A0A501WG39_9RHOB|nr:class I SAM-dependent methyltransferase [Amaricoccus solimangrovi]TPE48843.1 class I SAM-dependent methyltransferase [Amaricoccus solimangrovi]
MSQSDRLATAIASQAFDLPETGPIVFIRATFGPALALIGSGRLRCEQSLRPAHDALAEQGFEVVPRATDPAAAAIVALTRARVENFGNIARALALLPEGGLLVVDGAKTDGVDSLAKQVGAVLPLEGQFTKAHGRVFWTRRPARLPEAVTRWAEAARPARNADGFFTEPGIFSAEGIDPGSRRLAEILPGRIKGRVADLGAGWGWLSLQALAAGPEVSQIDLYEAEARALDMARLNVSDPRASFHWSDVGALGRGIPPYDRVIANPPFHRGRAAEPALGEAFIAAAARLLKPSGQFLMVANRQLPYEAALDARFRQWERLSEEGGYKVLCATRPRTDRRG